MLGVLRFYLLRRGASIVSGGGLYDCFKNMIQVQAIRGKVELLVTPHAALPMTGGVWRPTIFLPTEAKAWSQSRIQSVLSHELAHVKRRDSLFLVLIQCLAVYY